VNITTILITVRRKQGIEVTETENYTSSQLFLMK